MVIKDAVLRILPDNIKRYIAGCKIRSEELQEIRLRVNEWILLICNGKEYVLDDSSGASRLTAGDITDCFRRISEYSVYAYEEEIRQGYITISGGHRIGIAGKVIVKDGKMNGIKYITYINIRIADQKLGCADKVMPYIFDSNGFVNTLIISPPRGGKTTLLRDVIRQLSDGTDFIRGMSVGVVDERSEICACYRGVPQNDVGMRTDVLDACPKSDGIVRLVRSMAPEVIAVDEIGTYEDISAIEYALVSGCAVAATIHGFDMEDICRNKLIKNVVEKAMFRRYIFLGNVSKTAGAVKSITDEKGGILYDGG